MAKRLSQLSREHKTKFRVLGVVPGDQAREGELHAQFGHLRMEGEWFDPGLDLLDFIRDHGRPWNGLVEVLPSQADDQKLLPSMHEIHVHTVLDPLADVMMRIKDPIDRAFLAGLALEVEKTEVSDLESDRLLAIMQQLNEADAVIVARVASFAGRSTVGLRSTVSTRHALPTISISAPFDENSAVLVEEWRRFSEVVSDYMATVKGSDTRILHALPPPGSDEERIARMSELRKALHELPDDSFPHRCLQVEYRRLMGRRAIEANQGAPHEQPD